MVRPNRRRVLQAGGAALVTALAGCNGGSSNSADEQSEATESMDSTDTDGDSTGQNIADLEPVTVDEPWHMYQNGPRHTGSTENTMPSGKLEQRWQFEVEGLEGAPAEPIVADGTLYLIDATNTLRALNPSDGTEQWQADVTVPHVTPAYNEGTVYINGRNDLLEAYDASSGERQWRSDTAVGTGTLVEADGSVYGMLDGIVQAADAETGEQRWSTTLTETAINRAPVAVADGRVFASADAGVAPVTAALDAASGEVLWRNEYPEGLNFAATVANGTVYLPHDNGTLYALDPETGDELWTYQPGDSIDAEVTYRDGTVYVYGDSLSAVDASSGEQQWQVTSDSAAGIVSDGQIITAASTQLISHDRESGEKQWETVTDNYPTTTPVVANGLVFVGSEAGLTAYQAV